MPRSCSACSRVGDGPEQCLRLRTAGAVSSELLSEAAVSATILLMILPVVRPASIANKSIAAVAIKCWRQVHDSVQLPWLKVVNSVNSG